MAKRRGNNNANFSSYFQSICCKGATQFTPPSDRGAVFNYCYYSICYDHTAVVGKSARQNG